MALTLNESYAHRALLLVAGISSNLSKLTINCVPGASLRYENGVIQLSERAAIAKTIAASVPSLVGKNAISQALVQQW
jgi:hypothetical protein